LKEEEKYRKPLVYIASPYTKGIKKRNLEAHYNEFIYLNSTGLVTPIAPLANEAIHQASPQSYQYWIDYDLELVSRCDAVLAIDAVVTDCDGHIIYHVFESEGRDNEVRTAREQGIPVFTNRLPLLTWALGTQAGNTFYHGVYSAEYYI